MSICPFTNDSCHSECMFFRRPQSEDSKIVSCTLAIAASYLAKKSDEEYEKERKKQGND